MNMLLDEGAYSLLESPQLACDFVIPVINVCNHARYSDLQVYFRSAALRQSKLLDSLSHFKHLLECLFVASALVHIRRDMTPPVLSLGEQLLDSTKCRMEHLLHICLIVK